MSSVVQKCQKIAMVAHKGRSCHQETLLKRLGYLLVQQRSRLYESPEFQLIGLCRTESREKRPVFLAAQVMDLFESLVYQLPWLLHSQMKQADRINY
mmetsp:Transcript_36625/g.105377  ORF Transcript_36625/g.105377 Transcript_36625/m.105377 type:complete len:97 (-) Transcript_36625:886-1176(-)